MRAQSANTNDDDPNALRTSLTRHLYVLSSFSSPSQVLLPFVPGPEPECAARFAVCETNEDCCSGACRGSRFVFPFYRRCTLF